MTERLLPPREVCKRLGVSFITLKRWIYSGKIRAVKHLLVDGWYQKARLRR